MEARALQQPFDYMLVLDFEATCDGDVGALRRGERSNRPWPSQEIIEFPILMVNLASFATEAVFHYYVQPVQCPKLTAYCTELTGITQEQVDGGLALRDVLGRVDAWLAANRLSCRQDGSSRSFVMVTCGDWDMRHLERECRAKGLRVPSWSRSWCNIKQLYAAHLGRGKPGMAGMLRGLGLKLEGHHHSGIDDSRNIAKIAVKLANAGALIDRTFAARDAAAPWHGPSNRAFGDAGEAGEAAEPREERREEWPALAAAGEQRRGRRWKARAREVAAGPAREASGGA